MVLESFSYGRRCHIEMVTTAVKCFLDEVFVQRRKGIAFLPRSVLLNELLHLTSVQQVDDCIRRR